MIRELPVSWLEGRLGTSDPKMDLPLRANLIQIADMTTPIRRRTHAERKVTLHESVLNAAISTLHAHGYSATTTVMVAKSAGISRGAMQNHFPNKADLMVYVVEAVYAAELQEYHRLLEGINDRRERQLAYIDAAWEILSRPSGVAVLEIMLGSRSDAELADKLSVSLQGVQAATIRTMEEEFQRHLSTDLLRLIVWTIRGLSIDAMLDDENCAKEAAQMLRKLVQVSLDAGMFSRGSAAQ